MTPGPEILLHYSPTSALMRRFDWGICIALPRRLARLFLTAAGMADIPVIHFSFF
jgi:hypothetical protein